MRILLSMTITHGNRCGRRTFKTNCPGCDRSCFYYSCDYGSKVFFDALGDEWPIHQCPEIEIASRSTLPDGSVRVELANGVIITRAAEIQDTIAQKLTTDVGAVPVDPHERHYLKQVHTRRVNQMDRELREQSAETIKALIKAASEAQSRGSEQLAHFQPDQWLARRTVSLKKAGTLHANVRGCGSTRA